MFQNVVKVLYFLSRFHHFAPASLQERTPSDAILPYVTPSITPPHGPTDAFCQPNLGQEMALPKKPKYIAVLYGPLGFQKCDFYQNLS